MNQRRIDLTAATSIVVANMIGTGVFISLGFQLFDTSPGFPIVLIWLLGGILAFSGALCYAELASRLPEDGGEYYFLSKIYHPAVGFMAGFVSSTVGFAAPIAAAALALGSYLAGVFPGINLKLTATAVVVGISLIHITSFHAGIGFQKIFTALKVLVIAVFIVLGITGGNVQHIDLNPLHFEWNELVNPALAISLVWVSFAYSGWNASAYIAGSISNPGRNIPRSILLGTAIVTVLYVLINVVFMMAAPVGELVGKKEVGLIASNYIFGLNGGKIMGGIISLLLVSTISSMIIAGPRVLQPMFSKIQGLKKFAVFNNSGNPVYAIIFQTILSLVLLYTLNFESLIYYIAFTLSIFTVLAVFGVIILRFKYGKPEGYSVPLYPLFPILFIAATMGVAGYFVYLKPVESLSGILTAVLGLLVFRLSENYKKS